jgi:hypothetical protein
MKNNKTGKTHLIAKSVSDLSLDNQKDILHFINLIQKQAELVDFAGVLSGIQIPRTAFERTGLGVEEIEYLIIAINKITKKSMSIIGFDTRYVTFGISRLDMEALSEVKNNIKIDNENPVKVQASIIAENASSESPKKIAITDDSLIWLDKKVPLRRGQRSVMKILLKNAREKRNEKIIKNGEAVHRNLLQKEGGYRDDLAFRDALNKLRRKIKNNGFPMTIQNETTNYYLLEIKYK